jgi:glycine cleavage system transcriptional repressor
MQASANAPQGTSAPAERAGLVMTCIGRDRPGLISKIAAFVGGVGGNIEDTRMAKLGGEFAVLMFVSGPEATLAALESGRDPLEASLGLTSFTKRTEVGRLANQTLVYTMSVSALDRPGIVEALTRVLGDHSINVVSLSSRVEPAPWSGSPMFELKAELHIPGGVALPVLRRELDRAAERENLDYTLKAGRE